MLRLTINGQEHIFDGDLDPAMPLLWLLRDNVGLLGHRKKQAGDANSRKAGPSALRSISVMPGMSPRLQTSVSRETKKSRCIALPSPAISARWSTSAGPNIKCWARSATV